MTRFVPLIPLLLLSATACAFAQTAPASPPAADGYRGIWFTLGQRSAHGDKYSGGLATYTANHTPIAIHSPESSKTFFVYGGTIKGKRQQLQIMASYFDHATGKVPRPTVVHDKKGLNDPHDNAALALDGTGHVCVFVSGRARARPGFIYRSTQPFSVAAFDRIDQREMTYPQPRFIDGRGFFYLFTKYTRGRELYWQTSTDGSTWDAEQKLAGFGGHYQVSGAAGGVIGSAFMWHPQGKVDARTNLYYAQTRDFGKTWQALGERPPSARVRLRGEGGGAGPDARGGDEALDPPPDADAPSDRSSTPHVARPSPQPSPRSTGKRELVAPLVDPVNPALVVDYHSQKLNVYIHDLNFDHQQRPAILYLTSKGHQPGPDNGPRVWRVTRFDGSAWRTRDVCESDHNYDTGALFIDGDRWTVVGPTLTGPQPLGTGGDIAFWSSADAGDTWRQTRTLTRDSRFNHSYVRRVVGGKAPFEFLWADGDPDQLSESRLYFASLSSGTYYELPYDMSADSAEPIEHVP